VTEMLRVLICEGSRGYAVRLKRMLEHDGDITVAAICATAEEAIGALPRVQPDAVTMDLELPGMGGLAGIEEIMSERPLPVLVISAGADNHDKAAAALAAGALDAIGKDDLDLRDPGTAAAAAFRQRVRVLSQAHVIRHPLARLRLRGVPVRQDQGRPASVVGICGSTGGPYVLARLLRDLPADYPIPILVVQHISAGFTEGLARWLDQSVPLPVAVAADGAPAARGAWIAPEGAHLKLAPTGRLFLDRRTVAGHHRPSGDVLFESIAAVAGKAGVAIVLTGMGSDGASGAASVRHRGGLVIAQDKESSAIYGMPQAALGHGVDLVLSPGEIVAQLMSLRYQPVPWTGTGTGTGTGT
jgi:two-component system, chemotaxis family, protein-glutamate methylesterase/glutaminase